MADIPGIIEGAHEGKGLGLRFLKHIERNSSLLFVVSCDSKDIVDEYKVLLNELKKFNPDLLEKQRILAISKADLMDEELERDMTTEINKRLKGKSKVPFIFFSSATGKNVMKLKDMIWEQLNRYE
jgi:GTPase